MRLSIEARLDLLLPRISSALESGKMARAGEIGFYIFDYPPEHELRVRDYVDTVLLPAFQNDGSSRNVVKIDLYELLLLMLEEKGFLARASQLEADKGSDYLHKALKPLLQPGQFAAKIRPLSLGADLVLLTGVGKIWPLVRSHTVLNNLHAVLDETTVLMMFPGVYDQRELRLFGLFKDDNYYRAFKLVEDEARGGTVQ